MLDTAGYLVEGTMSNTFLVAKGELFTPALSRCGVEGVMRNVILQGLCKSLSLNVQVKDLALSDMYNADEVFICNSMIGILPVVAVGCHHKSVGNITKSLQCALTTEIENVIND